MGEIEHKSLFSARYLLALLPLLLMGAGVWYFVYGRMLNRGQETTAGPPVKVFGASSSPASAPSAAPAPAATLPVGAAGAVRLPEAYDPKAGIDIEGSPEFKSQVTHALKLIWQADRETFLFLKKNLHVIRNENLTGFYLDSGRPVAALSKAHAFRSLTWCAGIIAHQGWHAWYTMTKKRKVRPAPPLPGERDERQLNINPATFDYKGLDAILYIEDKASAFQLDVLKKTGAPASETKPVFRRAPREFQYAHDGNYALNP